MDKLAKRPDNVLYSLCQTVVDFCGAGSAGISLLSPGETGDTQVFCWPAIAGA
jgi:hypothetical protein